MSATTPAATAPPSATTSTDAQAASTAEKLQEEIHLLEDSIAEKRRVLDDKKRSLGVQETDFAEAERAAGEAEKRLAQAQEDFRAAEQTRQGLLPQYERCQLNKDQQAKAEALRKEIAEAEKGLRQADVTIRELEDQLQLVSAEYKSEREQRALLVSKFSQAIDDIRTSIEEKVASTVPIDQLHGQDYGSQLLRNLATLGRERETSLMQHARYVHELNAIVHLKKQRAMELRADSEREVSALKAAKDEEVRELLARFDDERASLQRDIFDLHEMNKRQQEELRRVKLLSDDHTPGLDTTPTGQSRRQGASRADEVLQHKLADLDRERHELTKKIKATSTERTRLLNMNRELARVIEAESAKHQAHIRMMESKIQRERTKALELERENKRLEEACDVLAAAIRDSAPRIEA